MEKYNIMPQEAFRGLTLKDPKFILSYMLDVSEANRRNPNRALLVPVSFIPKEAPVDRVVKDFGKLFTGSGRCRAFSLPADQAILRNMGNFLPSSQLPDSKAIRELSFDGYVCAGSAVVLACSQTDPPNFMPRSMTPKDADLFIHYDPSEKTDRSIEDRCLEIYRRLLNEMTDIVKIALGKVVHPDPNDSDYRQDYQYTITRRSEYCTTIMCAEFNVEETQIIQRAYTSATATVVGFDQMCCRGFFDGKMIYFTIEAALCLYFGINPVDWRCESPSHLDRVIKYEKYGFTPIFPGLPFNLGIELSNKTSNTGISSVSYILPSCYLTRDPESSSYRYRPDGKDRYGKNIVFPIPLKLINKKRYGFHPTIINENNHPTLELYRHPSKESDYDMGEESDYDKEQMASYYRALTMLIKAKFNFLPVFAYWPNEVLDKCHIPPIRMLLEKTYGGSFPEFYFGSGEIVRLESELSQLRSKYRGHYRSKLKILNKAEKLQALELESRIEQLLDERCQELETEYNDHLKAMLDRVNFITSNPGMQFTSSFHPIRRATPQEFWGNWYEKSEPGSFYQVKFTILCIRRFRNSCWNQTPLDVVKLIFSYFYTSYFVDLASNSHNYLWGDNQQTMIQPRLFCPHNLLPWWTVNCDCQSKCDPVEPLGFLQGPPNQNIAAIMGLAVPYAPPGAASLDDSYEEQDYEEEEEDNESD